MFDVIVVGARCAGSPVAMLLARRGYKVLLLDKARFPSDTVSTHYIHQSGIAHLNEWGLLDRVRASGCPAMTEIAWDIEGITFSGHPPTPHGVPEAFGPRREVLDAILVRAAVESGVEFREGFTVKEVDWDNGRVIGIRGRSHGGAMVTERARVVVGADGLHSTVARAVDASLYEEHSPRTHTYYTYWSGAPMQRLEFYELPGLGAAAFPTNDGLAMVSIAWSSRAHPAGLRGELEQHYLAALRRFPGLAERVLAGKRVARFAGMAKIPNQLRQAAGPGWALVGDAGYHKDPAAAQGITDAFRAAEQLMESLDAALTGVGALDDALADYARRRDDRAMPWYRWAVRFARFEELSPPRRDLFAAIAANPQWANRFCGLNAETVNPDEFFALQAG
jgi:flavin-dependent dehydrogenase